MVFIQQKIFILLVRTMNKTPRLVAETIGWYQWRQRIILVNYEYNYGDYGYVVNCTYDYNHRKSIMSDGFYGGHFFIRQMKTDKIVGLLPMNYSSPDQKEYKQMLIDVTWSYWASQNIDPKIAIRSDINIPK